MIIGFIGFGRVSKNLVKLINCEDITFITSTENRSDKTIDNINNANVEVLDSFREVASNSNILISATSPKSALDNAKLYGRYSKGIYLDLNNISPDTTQKINKYAPNLVDGAIIGKIEDNPVLYVSGKNSDKLLFFDKFLETRKISDNVGDVACLKLLRSTYTKTLTALLLESIDLAEKYDLGDEFFDILTLTEGMEFHDKSLSRINNTLNNPKRKIEELGEIIEYFEDDLIMVNAALEKLNQY